MSSATIAVIGCGNIGSRHLQALAQFNADADIYAVEPSDEARKTAQQRVEQINPADQLRFHYCSDIADIPARIDVAVIATGAAPRRMLTQTLLDHADVKYLILEKFLFQTLADHDAIGTLLAQKNVSCFVNTPRRMWAGYQTLRAQMQGAENVAVHVELGGRTSMSSNAIHFIDLAAFLADEPAGYALAGDDLALDGSSRHEGMTEFGGVMEGVSPNGHRFTCVARPHIDAPQMVMITSDKVRAMVDEARGQGWIANEDTGWEWQPLDMPVLYQSALTQVAAHDLIATGTCNLPAYAEAATLHKQCLIAFFEALGDDAPAGDKICPIT